MKNNLTVKPLSMRCSDVGQPGITLTDYIARRLGSSLAAQSVNFLAKPFGAPSYSHFWWYWNPVFGYYLYYYCYHPLRKVMPRAAALLITFIFCGLLHDMPFGLVAALSGSRPPAFTITVMFGLLGTTVAGSEKARLTFERVPVIFRWPIHGITIYLCWRIGLSLTTGT